jgi:hypothetical protein
VGAGHGTEVGILDWMTWLLALAVLPWLQSGESFTISPDALQCSGKENSRNWVRTAREYGDVRVRFEYKLAQWAEAVVVLRAHAVGRATLTGIPVQLAHDFHGKTSRHVTGAIVGVREPARFLGPSFGEWHKAEIAAVGERVTVRIDGELVNDAVVPGRHAAGHIGFLDLGHAYSVRGISIEDLGGAGAYEPLFNGRDMKGWELRDAGTWAVSEGRIVGENGHGIYYAPGSFSDFELLAVVKSVGHVNAGLFLRGAPDKKQNRGFEVQIYSVPDGVYPTGSIYGQTRGDLVEDHDGRWALLRIRVERGMVTTWVDGRLTAQGPVPDGAPAAGRVGLQIHLENARIECKELRIRRLGGGL